MRFRYLWSITLLVLCHPPIVAQLLTNALPGAGTPLQAPIQDVPDDPSQQILPQATLEPPVPAGEPVRWESLRQERVGDDWKLTGDVVLYYRNYIIHADNIVYHQNTDTVEASGHLQMEGGANDAILTASHGEIHPNAHTAIFYDVQGSFGVRQIGKTRVYSTADPFIFTGRMLLQTGENSYRIVDGSMTACRLPKPDWKLISSSIQVVNDKASTRNSWFEFWHVPLFYLPYVARPLDETGRESGLMLDGFENSGVKGFVFGEQIYWVINRSMDATIGAQYWSKRGFAPNGDFRYRGLGLDALNVRWNALLDRGIEEATPASTTGPAGEELVNQGGEDILATGRKNLTENSRVAGAVEYLSSYIYRLSFDENLAQATSSEVQSDVALTNVHRGFVSSLALDRFQTFAPSDSTTTGPLTSVPEARILHLPQLRFDAIDQPLGALPLYAGFTTSVADLQRAEPHFHARNVGRLDLYPHIEWPIHLGDWQFVPAFALRTTEYSGSQIPNLSGEHFGGVPFVKHDSLNRSDVEASFDLRAPAVERDFSLGSSNRILRHVIEPEIFYHYVTGINNARDTLLFDSTDIATNTNEAGYSITQRFYVKPAASKPCSAPEPGSTASGATSSNTSQDGNDSEPAPISASKSASIPAACTKPAREWASWQVSQKFFFDPTFGGALISGRRNVFDTTLDYTAAAFLTAPRSIAPIISRLRFEAIDRLRIEWDFDYDTKAGRINASNVFAGYSFGRTTIGASHAVLNAVDESGSTASVTQSQQLQPYIYIGKPSDAGLSVALNASYDFAHSNLQYAGAEAVYNWNCCGLELGYRRFELGTLRDEPEWLWGFTLSSIGTAGNIHRSNSVFPAPDILQRLY